MGGTDLQALFDEPIEEIQELDPGYSEHASDVWLVRTALQEVIVRTSRWHSEPSREFWWGCKFIFGIDPRDMGYFESNLRFVNAIQEVPAPKAIARKQSGGRDYLIVEKMRGAPLNAFTNQSGELLRQFGVWLAKVHRNSCDYYGNLAGTRRGTKEQFHDILAQAMIRLVDMDYRGDSAIASGLEGVLEELAALPNPQSFCPILIDMDPSQFLTEDGLLTAIVDAEAYVLGPREFDFIGLEYVLDERSARAFIDGYTTVLTLPRLSECRRPYRYLYRLLGVQGSVDLDRWFAQAELF